ncbi:subtilase-type proteinase ISP6 [Acrasis kona]|uniref:Subtilase-type proteinase ISP6 n=1 Tax=Acrasis kona TaxID=1008807 RepID=A0AAW2YJG9_9EUKA
MRVLWIALVIFTVTCDQYIIRTRKNAQHVYSSENIAPNHDYVFGNLFYGFSAELDAQQAIKLEQNPLVISVTKSKPLILPIKDFSNEQPNPISNTTEWNLDQLDGVIDKRYIYEGDGHGVDCYIVDSGINTNHTQLQGRAIWGANFCTKEKNIDRDLDGHGTHVAGIVGSKDYGVARNVTLIAVKVSGETGGNQADLLAGLNWVLKKATTTGRPSLINISMGLGFDEAINLAVQALTEAGIAVVAASGNFFSDACGISPASSPFVFTVAASGPKNMFWEKSNHGKCVNVIAPGVNIKSLTAWGRYVGDDWYFPGMSSRRWCCCTGVVHQEV